MIDAGFNLVSLATNHTLDSGEKAVLNSRNYWNSKSNVLAVGSYSSTEERNEVHVEEANGITIQCLIILMVLMVLEFPAVKNT